MQNAPEPRSGRDVAAASEIEPAEPPYKTPNKRRRLSSFDSYKTTNGPAAQGETVPSDDEETVFAILAYAAGERNSAVSSHGSPLKGV